MSDIIGFGQGDKKIMSGGDLTNYRGEKGRRDVVSFCWFMLDDDGNPILGDGATPKMISTRIHYIKGLGYINDNEYLSSRLGPPKAKIGTFLVHYRTDRKGKLVAPLEYEIKPWTFGPEKFRRLSAIHDRFNLTENDFEISCEDETYQKLTFTPIPGGAIWQKKEGLRKEVLEAVADMQDRLKIGRDVPLDELKDHFGEDEDLVPDASVVGDYDSLMAGIE